VWVKQLYNFYILNKLQKLQRARGKETFTIAREISYSKIRTI